MINPVVVSFSTVEKYEGIDRFRSSLEAWDWKYRFIFEPTWKGFGYRLKRTLQEIEPLKAMGFTHLISLDMFDTIAVGPPVKLERKLASYGNPAILSATEAACWPNIDGLVQKYEPRLSHWWYPHSPYVLDLNQPLQKGFDELDNAEDDQLHMHHMFLAKTTGFVLDRRCEVVQSIAHSSPWQKFFSIEEDVDFDRYRVRNNETWSLPLFAHGNGRTDLSWVPGSFIEELV